MESVTSVVPSDTFTKYVPEVLGVGIATLCHSCPLLTVEIVLPICAPRTELRVRLTFSRGGQVTMMLVFVIMDSYDRKTHTIASLFPPG